MGCCASEEIAPQAPPTGSLEKPEAKKDPKAMGSKTEDPTAGRKKKYAKNAPIKLGYWKIRGLAQPIRYLLEYTEHPYEDVHYEQGDGPNFSVEEWTSVKNTLGLDFPTVPYVIDGEAKVTDPYAIMVYLSHAYAPELLGKTPAETGEMDMFYSQLKEIKQHITGPCYTQTDKNALGQQAVAKIAPIIQYLGKKDYLFGNELRYLDFYLLELFDFIQWLTENKFFTEQKAVARYVKRVKGLRQMKRYIKSERYMEKPFNNKVAKINNL